MKKAFLHIIFAAMLILFFNSSLVAQAQDVLLLHGNAGGSYLNPSAKARVGATIVKTYKAMQTTSLKFGKIVPNESKSHIKISTDGKRNVSGDMVVKDNSYSPARYFVSGGNAVSYKIILPKSDVVLTNANNLKTITVTDWVADFITDDEMYSANGNTQGVILGATLNVGSKDENPAGVYDGSYAITFLYN